MLATIERKCSRWPSARPWPPPGSRASGSAGGSPRMRGAGGRRAAGEHEPAVTMPRSPAPALVDVPHGRGDEGDDTGRYGAERLPPGRAQPHPAVEAGVGGTGAARPTSRSRAPTRVDQVAGDEAAGSVGVGPCRVGHDADEEARAEQEPGQPRRGPGRRVIVARQASRDDPEGRVEPRDGLARSWTVVGEDRAQHGRPGQEQQGHRARDRRAGLRTAPVRAVHERTRPTSTAPTAQHRARV